LRLDAIIWFASASALPFLPSTQLNPTQLNSHCDQDARQQVPRHGSRTVCLPRSTRSPVRHTNISLSLPANHHTSHLSHARRPHCQQARRHEVQIRPGSGTRRESETMRICQRKLDTSGAWMMWLGESGDLSARDDLSSFVRKEGMGRRPFAFGRCGLRRASGDLSCAGPHEIVVVSDRLGRAPGKKGFLGEKMARERCVVVVWQLATGKGRRLRQATSARSFVVRFRRVRRVSGDGFWCAWRPTAGGLAGRRGPGVTVSRGSGRVGVGGGPALRRWREWRDSGSESESESESQSESERPNEREGEGVGVVKVKGSSVGRVECRQARSDDGEERT
jgi:hypothetical protein